jgi:hypothetical protein
MAAVTAASQDSPKLANSKFTRFVFTSVANGDTFVVPGVSSIVDFRIRPHTAVAAGGTFVASTKTITFALGGTGALTLIVEHF